jgi:hypothetical protein
MSDHASHVLDSTAPVPYLTLVGYTCALEREWQGVLYVGADYLCFYSKIFSKTVRAVIPVDTVQLVEKDKKLFFQNSLRVHTETSKYTFTNFMNRDACYGLVMEVWKNQLSTGTVKKVDRRVSLSDANRPANLPTPSDPMSVAMLDKSKRSVTITPKSPSTSSGQKKQRVHVAANGPCGCVDHYRVELMDVVLALDPSTLFSLLFGEDQHAIPMCGANIRWKRTPSGGWGMREFNYQMEWKPPMMPKITAQCAENQRILLENYTTRIFRIQSEIRTSSVPYGERFSLVLKWCISTPGDSTQGSRLVVTGALECKKQVIISQNLLEKAAVEAALARLDAIRSELLLYQSTDLSLKNNPDIVQEVQVEPLQRKASMAQPPPKEKVPTLAQRTLHTLSSLLSWTLHNSMKLIIVLLALFTIHNFWNLMTLSSTYTQHKHVSGNNIQTDYQYEKAVIMSEVLAKMRASVAKYKAAIARTQRLNSWLVSDAEQLMESDKKDVL